MVPGCPCPRRHGRPSRGSCCAIMKPHPYCPDETAMSPAPGCCAKKESPAAAAAVLAAAVAEAVVAVDDAVSVMAETAAEADVEVVRGHCCRRGA